MKETAYDMLYLAACAVNNINPNDERIAKIDFHELFQISQFHSLSAIVCMGLESAGIADASFMEAKSKAIRKNILLDAERKIILDFMEQNKILYMPLKGVILKELYPKLGMRQMSDNDIYYDKSFQMQLCTFMKNRGYTAESVGKKNHDTYLKPPVYNFEMHTELFPEKEKKLHDYYSKIQDRLIKDKINKYGFYLSDEDFYVYMTAHEYKHYFHGGIGVRSILDCYVYLKEKEKLLDWDFIRRQTDILGITEFEQKSRNLSKKVFEDPDHVCLSDEEREMLEFYLLSGTHGTRKHVIDYRIEEFTEKTGSTSKFRYILYRIFPPIEHYEQPYPFFYRHRILLPIGWAFRLLKGITVRRKKAKEELHLVHDSNKLL